MAVIILHPTEELIFAKLQKELISELFEDDRIMIAVKPLWIPFNPVNPGNECEGGFDTTLRVTQPPAVGELEFSEDSVFLPVTVYTEAGQYNTKLTLVILHIGRKFTEIDHQKITKIKQPVRQLKVFRLGLEKEFSSNSKCITESRWCKLHNTRTTVK